MRLFLMLLALGLMPMLASCANPLSQHLPAARPALTPPSMPTQKGTGATNPPPVDPLCAALTPIALSHADTDGTKAQVIAQNQVIDEACRKRA
jgi:hypothetical protein